MSRRGSTVDSVDELRQQLVELRGEFRRLQARVDHQEETISSLSRELEESRLSQELDSSGLSAIEKRSESGQTPGSYSLVTAQGSGGVANSASAGISAGVEERHSLSYREEVAREIGAFLRRAVDGQRRGLSGREKLSGFASKIYLVVRDFDGVTTEKPLRVFSSFATVKRLCSRAGSWGDSVFVGLPSIHEGQVAAAAAGCTWPADFN